MTGVTAKNRFHSSIVHLSLRTHRILTFLFGFPQAFWCGSRERSGSFFTASRDQIHHTVREDSPQSERHHIAEKMMLTFAESTQPVFRSTSPLSRGMLKRKGDGKLSLDFCADKRTIETVFGTLISVNQLSLHWAIAEMCEEFDVCNERKGDPL